MPFGRGFGFRGWSPPWPYVGFGRGGLPRCWAYGYSYIAPIRSIDKNQEIQMLSEQARVLREQLEMIKKRIMELEKKES